MSHWPLWGEFTSDAENVSIWWRHHAPLLCNAYNMLDITIFLGDHRLDQAFAVKNVHLKLTYDDKTK